MLIELGPVNKSQVHNWTRFARRILCELRLKPDDLDGLATTDLLNAWAHLIEKWETHLAVSDNGNGEFRWSGMFESEQAEYLLHGFERSLHSRSLRQQITEEEQLAQQEFTLHIFRAFVDALASEGQSCQHYVDQIRTSMGHRLEQ